MNPIRWWRLRVLRKRWLRALKDWKPEVLP
jgi:hypothetical protein